MQRKRPVLVASNDPKWSERPITALDCDAIVLGAGVTGLVSASVLAQQGCRRILVVDEYDHIGGNHIDWSSGDCTFDVGSFIFQDDSPLLRHFPELLEHYVPIDPTWGRLNPQRMVTAYPISIRDDILAAGPYGVLQILMSAAYSRVFQRRIGNAREYARYWIGQTLLHRSGLDAYMARFYGIAPDKIDVKLAEKRMRWIGEHASLRSLLGKVFRRKHHAATNRQLARPRSGFAALYNAARKNLESRGVTFALSANLQRLERRNQLHVLTLGDREITAGRVVSTIPIERICEVTGFQLPARLESIRLISLFYSFEGKRGFDQSVLYNFSHAGAWKRITVYSDFYGPAAGREYFAAEVIAHHVGNSVEKAAEDFSSHVRANALFAGDLRLEGSFTLDNAYPIYSRGAAERAAEAVEVLKSIGVESFGRQGGFDYQPTARVSTIVAEAALDAPLHAT